MRNNGGNNGRCQYSVFIEIRSLSGTQMYKFEERPCNLITGFAATEQFIKRNFKKNPYKQCNITAHIKDSENRKIFEIKRVNQPIMTCLNPLLAFSDVKLGIRYRRIIPQFRSFNPPNVNMDF